MNNIEHTAKKRIVILATGGTIAGKGESGKTAGYKPGEINIDSLLDSVPGIRQLADITGEQVLNTASDNITTTDLINLTKRINKLALQDDIDGFVITHGTDTLEETSYFLTLTVKTSKPVVCVGAMRPSTATSADGPFNLYQGVALARSEQAIGQGVLLVFSDGIYSGRDAQKISTFRTEGFNSRDLGCLGYMRDEQVNFYNKTVIKHTIDTEFDVSNIDNLPKVSIAYFHIDACPDILSHILKKSDGVVIAGAGNGGHSTKWRDVLKEWAENPIPVVLSSRVGNGIVTLHPNPPKQCIPSGTLSPQKARILLQLALTKTKDTDELKRMFLEY